MAPDDAAERTPGEPPGRPVRDGLLLAFAVGIVGIIFGVLARSSGLSVAKTCALSLLVFTGASQLAAVSVIDAGGAPATALGSALMLAARNTLYGPVVARWFPDRPMAERLAVAQLIIDESTGMGAAQSDPAQQRKGFVSAGLGTYVFWNLGTLVGAVAGDVVGDLQQWGLDAAFPAVYVAMLAPHLRRRPGRISALIAAAIAIATVPFLPVGIPILASTLGAFGGAVLAARRQAPNRPETP
ncbi:MAG TPA: AzlC family ABC transporter permease [Microthrixaceae bacterium]|nr:AzlC family ABC transporter permease [Microthrixaceae bacterium]HNI36021.1 AzlC family ABC transporter permease [Microthrixaceae bacterium]